MAGRRLSLLYIIENLEGAGRREQRQRKEDQRAQNNVRKTEKHYKNTSFLEVLLVYY